ncbi:MAG: EamA family transporter [Alphaproteobacteria bacterium]
MTLSIFLLVLLAAITHASWNALVKVSGDSAVVMGVISAVGGLAGLVALPFVAPPEPESWRYLALTTAIHLGYYVFLVRAYQSGDLNQIYPIARGGSPLVLALVSWPVIGEALSWGQYAGVGLISIGIAVLALGRGNRRSLMFAAATACAIAAYSATDALGVRSSGSPFGYIAWLFFLDGTAMAALTLWSRGRAVFALARRDWLRAAAGGLLSVIGYAIVVRCYAIGPVAPISALRETSVLIAALIGSLVLNETFGARRVAASAVVVAGIFVMSIA